MEMIPLSNLLRRLLAKIVIKNLQLRKQLHLREAEEEDHLQHEERKILQGEVMHALNAVNQGIMHPIAINREGFFPLKYKYLIWFPKTFFIIFSSLQILKLSFLSTRKGSFLSFFSFGHANTLHFFKLLLLKFERYSFQKTYTFVKERRRNNVLFFLFV